MNDVADVGVSDLLSWRLGVSSVYTIQPPLSTNEKWSVSWQFSETYGVTVQLWQWFEEGCRKGIPFGVWLHASRIHSAARPRLCWQSELIPVTLNNIRASLTSSMSHGPVDFVHGANRQSTSFSFSFLFFPFLSFFFLLFLFFSCFVFFLSFFLSFKCVCVVFWANRCFSRSSFRRWSRPWQVEWQLTGSREPERAKWNCSSAPAPFVWQCSALTGSPGTIHLVISPSVAPQKGDYCHLTP